MSKDNQKDAKKLDKKNYIEKDSIFQNVKTVADDLEEVKSTFKEISAMSHISSIKDSLAISCQRVETVKVISQKYESRVITFTEENSKFNEMYNDLSLQLSKTKSGLENAKQTESFQDKTRLSEVQEFINSDDTGKYDEVNVINDSLVQHQTILETLKKFSSMAMLIRT
mgnify:CR=1 FL=1